MSLILLLFLIYRVNGLAIETKLDLPDSTSLVGPNGIPVTLDSSLSPKIVKAFFEINFVPVAKPVRNRPFVSVSNPCPYSTELCKFYFVPTKVSTVQKVEDMIEKAKKDSDIPVIQGLAVPDQEKLLRELNSTIMSKVNKVVPLNKKKNDSDEVPVYRGTVNIDQVLKSPEISSLPEYRPQWPEIKRTSCLQGPCYWRNEQPPPIYSRH